MIKDIYCLCRLTTGDMLRASISTKTLLGVKANEAMENGKLVSDDIVVVIINHASLSLREG
ncbi:adenylate kinase/UMP-CMP kinase, P-loop containing nucleoside triphosphate hydrolase [Artemisia annua]|uniref:Adenylate kinase/UMP-CMP kinase, P-loop containing nucleoside triphosphate hydrolase n=1 Tax=Artemisia annua TaxID=35608 RepID=A0A2U1L1P8_ARTAN|nr:adenylate kinase/UMP-CMP kinase, P-loop containing nucleoside triphosphate hydrolase [Artemisia annua]